MSLVIKELQQVTINVRKMVGKNSETQKRRHVGYQEYWCSHSHVAIQNLNIRRSRESFWDTRGVVPVLV